MPTNSFYHISGEDRSFEKHGYKGQEAGRPYNYGNSPQPLNDLKVKIPGFEGMITCAGGAWENAVYKVQMSEAYYNDLRAREPS